MTTAVFSSSGKYVVTGINKLAKLWDINNPGDGQPAVV